MTTPSEPDLQPDRELVDEFARQVLAAAAPEELAVFEETSAEFHRDPEGVLSARGRDEAVGFGLDLALLTPYVLAVATPVLGFLMSTVLDAARDEARPVVADLVRRLFRRAPPDAKEKPIRLTSEQAARVRDVAYDRAVDLGLPPDKARLLADAVAGGLAVAT